MRIVCFEAPSQRSTWSPHGIDGFYVGPAMNHHRCFTVYIPSTHATRITGQLSWHPPPAYQLPGSTPADYVLSCISRLQASIEHLAQQHPHTHGTAQALGLSLPSLTLAIDHLSALLNPPSVDPVPALPPSQALAPAAASSQAPPAPQRVTIPTIPAAPQRVAAPPEPAVPERVHPIHPWLLQAASVKMSDAFALDNNNRPLTYRATRTAWDHDLWRTEESNELLRLLEVTKTMHWIDPSSKPAGRIAAYYNPQVKAKLKDGVLHRRVRGTYGGNISDYDGIRSSFTADMQTVKLLLNAVVSEDANFCTADIKDFYLGSDLEGDNEYMWLTREQVPDDILAKYGSNIIWHGNRTMVCITKGIYGLPHAGRLANQKLCKLLASHGYHPTATSCLFKHEVHDTYFALVVDDFAIKYSDRAHADHLFNAIRTEYDLDIDWDGSKFIGMSIVYDRAAHTITLSMPGYVVAALKRFGVTYSGRPTHGPSKFQDIIYGQKIQFTSTDDSPACSPSDASYIREVIGVFLYYARAIDSTMLPTLSKLASSQASPTTNLYHAVQHFLQYAATYPSAELRYHASHMRLVVWSDASYLSEPKSRSRAGGLHYLSSAGDPPTVPVNGAIEAVSTIIPTVVSSAAEAELAGLFLSAQTALSTRTTLASLGYPQLATPLLTDNTTAAGIANQTVRLKRSKAMDMRYDWLTNRVSLGDYTVSWGPGGENLADYYTKIHPPKHYQSLRHLYVQDPR